MDNSYEEYLKKIDSEWYSEHGDDLVEEGYQFSEEMDINPNKVVFHKKKLNDDEYNLLEKCHNMNVMDFLRENVANKPIEVNFDMYNNVDSDPFGS